MKALRNPYVISVLVALAVVLGYFRFRTPPVVPAPSAAQPPRPPMVGPDASMELEKLGWIPSPVRDPFGPPVHPTAIISDQTAEPVADVLELKAVWLQETGGWAVINGKVLGEGDTILNFRVEKILPDGVLVQGPDGRRLLGFKAVSSPPRASVAGAASPAGKVPARPMAGIPLTVAQDSTAAIGSAKSTAKSGP
jgi:hypothetical protein